MSRSFLCLNYFNPPVKLMLLNPAIAMPKASSRSGRRAADNDDG